MRSVTQAFGQAFGQAPLEDGHGSKMKWPRQSQEELRAELERVKRVIANLQEQLFPAALQQAVALQELQEERLTKTMHDLKVCIEEEKDKAKRDSLQKLHDKTRTTLFTLRSSTPEIEIQAQIAEKQAVQADLLAKLHSIETQSAVPSGVRDHSTPSKQARGKFGLLAEALLTACSRAGWNVCIGQKSIAGVPPGIIQVYLTEADQTSAEAVWPALQPLKHQLLPETKVDFQLDLLGSNSEEVVQAVLERLTEEMIATRDSCNGPFFKYPSKSSSGQPCYTLTGKPTAASTLLPLFLEIKSDSKCRSSLVDLDFEALLQGFERIETTMANGGYLSRCAALVATGNSKWIISALRTNPEKPREVTVSLLRLSMVQVRVVERVWMSMSKAAQEDPKFHLTPDGPLVVQALRAASFPPAFCRVKFLKRGMFNVYECTVPIKDAVRQTTIVLETESKQHRFCIKAITNATEFETESTALHRIALRKDALVQRFYFLGSSKAGATTVAWRDSVESPCEPAADLAAMIKQNWWQLGTAVHHPSAAVVETKTEADTTVKGGAILMRRGEPVDFSGLNKQQLRRLWDELRSWLHLYHAAGVLHADLRWSNVIDFGDDGIQPIDFGMSAVLAAEPVSSGEAVGTIKWEATSELILGPGGRSKEAGQRIRALVETAVAEQGDDFAVPVQWSQADDWDTLLEMALHTPGRS